MKGQGRKSNFGEEQHLPTSPWNNVFASSSPCCFPWFATKFQPQDLSCEGFWWFLHGPSRSSLSSCMKLGYLRVPPDIPRHCKSYPPKNSDRRSKPCELRVLGSPFIFFWIPNSTLLRILDLLDHESNFTFQHLHLPTHVWLRMHPELCCNLVRICKTKHRKTLLIQVIKESCWYW